MRIYYHGAYGKDDVLSATPVEAGESEARSVYGRLGPGGSFMGILISPGRIFQFYFNSDATVHAEILKVEGMETRSTTVTVPLGEMLIEAIYHGEDVEQKIGFSRVIWIDEKLRTGPIKAVETTEAVARPPRLT